MSVLLAATLQQLFNQATPQAPLRRWLDLALPAQWILASALLLGVAVWTQDPDLRFGLLLALATVAVLGAGFWWFSRRTSGALFAISNSAALFLLVSGFAYSAGQDLLLAGKRDRMEVAQFLISEAPPSIPIATLGTGNETYVYYVRRRVLGIESASKVRTALDNSGSAQLILILRRSSLESLPEIKREILFQSDASAQDPLLVMLLES